MKDYVVRIARLGDILIRAASAEEAASMAARLDKDIKIKGKKRKAKKWRPL